MIEENVKDALRDLALDAPEGPDDLAASAWAGGQRLRRRRSFVRVGLAVCATVVVCGAMLVVASPSSETHLPLAPPVSKKVDDRLPPKRDEAGLPQLITPYPVSVDPDPLQAVPLSQDPVFRAVALFQTAPDDPVLVLGDDGRMRRIEIVFDALKTGAGALGASALSIDGRSAVFPQRDKVVLVDLTSGSSRDIRAPGANESAALSADGRQVAVTDEDTTTIRRASDGVELVGLEQKAPLVAAPDGFFGVGPGGMVHVTFGGGDLRPGTYLHAEYGDVGEWWSLPAVNGTRLAAAGFGGYDADSVVLAFEGRTGEPRFRTLGASTTEGRWKGGTRPLKWLDDTTLLLLSDGEQPRVLGWNTRTGEITRVMHVQRKSTITL